jgi:hypothetical protein
MFGFLTPVRNDAVDPLMDVAAAHSFWQSLPKGDPIAVRQAVCKALAEPVARGGSSVDRLQALLVLDQYARSLLDALLANEVAGSPRAPSIASQTWQAALELCRRFSRVYGQFLRSMRDNREFEDRRDCQSLVVLRLFRHRKRELLLRPFSDEGAPFSWIEVHEGYRFAQTRGLLHESIPLERNHSLSTAEPTLEREYVHVLIQDLMNGGNFSPGNASWVSHRIPRWCAGMVLTPDKGGGSNGYRFVVDPLADAGLMRSNVESAGTCLCLDMGPLRKSIRDEIASLSDATDSPTQPWSSGRQRRLRALQKVNGLCAAERPVISRRGERTPTALRVEVVMGLPQILREVRAHPEDAPSPCPDGATPVTRSAGTASPWRLTMVDQSDSGCRLHGPARAANPSIPGALIAFREDSAAPWNLAVVRRVKKRLAGRRVEIGAEYVGKGPCSVVVVIARSDVSPDRAADTELPRFAALYVPESTEHPLLPIKTLILPPCRLSPGDRVFLRSGTSVHTIRLKQPLEERADFVWSSFEVLDH